MKLFANVIGTAALASVLMMGGSLAQDIQERTIRWGHLNNTDHPVSFGVKKFIEIVAAKSGGKLRVREFPANQLGPEVQQTAALRGGSQEMQSPASTTLVGIVKEFGLFDLPFIVSTPQQADALLDGPVGTALLAKLPEKDLVGLAFWDLGFRNVTNSRRAVTKQEDLDGLKLRVMPNPVYIDTFKAFKANPLPMSFSELYTALETRTVDGQENPYSVILSNKMYDVQKYLSKTNHTYSTNIILVSKKFWDRLSPAEQRILKDAAIEARDYQRKVSREQADKAVGELKSKGMLVNDITPAELARMRNATKDIAARVTADYDPALVKLFNDELARIHAQK